jgi:peptidoglycan-associated lipoprotein
MYRRSMAKERLTVVMMALFIAVAGCQSTKNPVPETAAMPNDTLPDTGHVEGSLIEPRINLETIHFDTDRADLRASAKDALASDADQIKAHPEWGVVSIEGHCDERGSSEHNLTLGQRRAEAVKRYLVDRGVPMSRLMTVSFGESKPIVFGHDETAWQMNRRTELKPEDRTASIR